MLKLKLELLTKKKSKKEAIDVLSEQIMDMYSKDFDECKYQLFYEFRDKKHGAWNVKYFIMDFEEEKKIDATLANA